jgi:copper(I)-binding protein
MKKVIAVVIATSMLLVLSAGVAGAHEKAEIKVKSAWVRSSPMEANAGAVFMFIKNTGKKANTLVSASVEPEIAGKAELHKTIMTSEGTMKMVPVDKIKLPAGKQVVLKPGDYHIMLLELNKPLEVGEKFEVTLRFAKGPKVAVMAEVRGEESMGMHGTTATTSGGMSGGGMSGGGM